MSQTAPYSQNVTVPALSKWLPGILLAVCAGCATDRQDVSTRPADWEHPIQQQPVSIAAAIPDSPAASGQASPANGALPSAPTTTNGKPNGIAVPLARALPATNPAPAPPPSTSAAAAATTVPKSSRTTLVSLRDWCSAVGLAAPAQAGPDGQSFTVTSPQGVMLIRAANQVAKWNGMDLHLGYPPQLIQETLYLQAADIKSTLAPLLRAPQPLTTLGKVVVIDPGHGGTDSGARSAGWGLEKDLTLDWARRLQPLLAADGWQVVITRSRDVEMPLTNRVVLAETAQADIFLSLHFNSAAPDKAGLETYCLTPAGVPSTLTRGYADELDLTLPNNYFDAKNLQLAVMIHRSLLSVNGGKDRGIRRARFPTVLRTQNRPAVLIEAGYLSNPDEAKMIATPGYRQKLAEAVAAALRPFAPAPAAQITNAPGSTASPGKS